MTSFSPEHHRRRSVRLEGYDYAGPGIYFITLCTRNRESLFGTVEDELMRLNPLGRIVAEEWDRSGIIRPECAMDEMVVMPNHLHGLVWFRGPADSAGGDAGWCRGAQPCAPTWPCAPT